MLRTTGDAVGAVLKGDPEVTVSERARIMALIRNHGKAQEGPPHLAPEKRVLTRAEVARRFSRTTRFVDGLGSSGALRRVKLPGRTRACGYLAEEVERLMAGEGGEA